LFSKEKGLTLRNRQLSRPVKSIHRSLVAKRHTFSFLHLVSYLLNYVLSRRRGLNKKVTAVSRPSPLTFVECTSRLIETPLHLHLLNGSGPAHPSGFQLKTSSYIVLPSDSVHPPIALAHV